MLDRCMAQLVAGSSNSGYKPRLGRDITLQELAGAFEVSRRAAVHSPWLQLAGGRAWQMLHLWSCTGTGHVLTHFMLLYSCSGQVVQQSLVATKCSHVTLRWSGFAVRPLP